MEDLQLRLFDLSARNPFIHIKRSQLYSEAETGSQSLQKLYQKANFFRKEYDLEVTLKVYLFLKWQEPGRDEFFISPLVYRPCKIKRKRKIEQEFAVQEQLENEYLINPILKHSFGRYFDINFPNEITEIDKFIKNVDDQLSTANYQLNVVGDFNDNEQWEIIQKTAIGNFNYKKSLLGEDYNTILNQTSDSIRDLLNGNSFSSKNKSEDLFQILPLDFSQKQAVQYANSNSLVIQGPPGTGKSHTIVGLIGHFLSKNKKVLFISQKRTALEVVYERLKKLGLANLAAFMNTDKDEKKSFYKTLKKSWDTHQNTSTTPQSITKSSFDLLDFYLNTYQDYNEHLGRSIHEAILLLNKLNFKKEDLSIEGKVPSLKNWMDHLSFIEKLEELSCRKLKIENLSEAFYIELNKAVFSENEPILKLEKRLDELLQTSELIKSIQDKYGFNKDLKAFTTLSLAASILSMVDRNQLDLLNLDSKEYKRFSNTAKKYQLLKSKVKRANQATSNWTNKPTKSELIELIDLLKHSEAPRGIFGFLKRNNERLQNAFKSFNKSLTTTAKLQLLEELRNEYHLESQLEELRIKLKHLFNLNNPDNEIEQILYLRNKLNVVSPSDYLFILEHENNIELINQLAKVHPQIQSFNHLSRFIFDEPPTGNLEEISSTLNRLKEKTLLLKELQGEVQEFFALPRTIIAYIRKNSGSIKKLTAAVAYHSILEQVRFEPSFQKLSGNTLKSQVEAKIKSDRQLNQNNVQQIKFLYSDAIKNKETLLGTPASKLSEDEKKEKKDLRVAKRLIIHEMNKVQQHLPVKEFIEKSWDYLKDLQPLWMMSPLSVSERLPCNKEIFDVVIFDESSQIPLEDSLPAVYRAKQLIVVGDEQQMPPSLFFSASNPGQTLLDRSELMFKKCMLKYHYRSQHPDLIQFSNDYFYENELIVPPSAQVKSPLEVKYVKGVFENNKNLEEAKTIAKRIRKIDINDKSLGIIAFSKEQEETIRKEIEKVGISTQDLLIRNLENVQGIERDEIWISLGYAKNKEGVFRLNFGPVNRENGRNRLNVLFTRAKKKIVLFTSVQPEDFGYSENQGVTCLKDYLNYAFSKGSDETKIDKVEKKEIILLDPCISEGVSKDVITQYTVLKDRFKSVDIVLTYDLWQKNQ